MDTFVMSFRFQCRTVSKKKPRAKKKWPNHCVSVGVLSTISSVQRKIMKWNKLRTESDGRLWCEVKAISPRGRPNYVTGLHNCSSTSPARTRAAHTTAGEHADTVCDLRTACESCRRRQETCQWWPPMLMGQRLWRSWTRLTRNSS